MYTQFEHFFLWCGHFFDEVNTSRLAGEMAVTQNRPEMAQSARKLASCLVMLKAQPEALSRARVAELQGSRGRCLQLRLLFFKALGHSLDPGLGGQ